MQLILVVLLIGLSGIVAQVLLLRELLINFYGNELTIGIILANWIMAEACGVFCAGKIVDRIKDKFSAFILFQVLFSISLPASIFLCRIIKSISGIPFGEAVGIPQVFLGSFIVVSLVSFSHGALFSSVCKIHSLLTLEPKASLGKVFALENLGTIIGGLAVTYLLIPFLKTFEAAFIISLLNLSFSIFFYKYLSKPWRWLNSVLILLILIISFLGKTDFLESFSISRQWSNLKVLESRNSPYGNVTVTRQREQVTFFYNGLPIITTPFPDLTFVQEFGNLPLLFHESPEDILVINAGAGGLINEVLKHSIKRLDYAELDPLLIEMVKKYPCALTENELTDKRVNVAGVDGRLFVKNTTTRYDVILLGIAKPVDLETNRFLTEEFFRLAKERLNYNGIVAFCLPGSLTYISKELNNLNACILSSFKDTFKCVRIIPGDYNMYLGSDSGSVLSIDSQLVSVRMNQRKIKADILVPDYLDYRLSRKWIDWFSNSIKANSWSSEQNSDIRPIAVFNMLILWNKQYSSFLSNFFSALKRINLFTVTLFLFILGGGLYLLQPNRYSARTALAYSIFTTGFFGMLANLLLLFAFQVCYGVLYQVLGLFMSIFTAGVVLGGCIIAKNKNNQELRVFRIIELLILAFVLLGAITIADLIEYKGNPIFIFMPLFFICGLFLGLEFPLAGRSYLGKDAEIGKTAGVLYASDLLGGWLAGVLGGIILLPILGMVKACLLTAFFKLGSIFLLSLSMHKKR
jgi:spermidine synthase